jgi:hypothetical protein
MDESALREEDGGDRRKGSGVHPARPYRLHLDALRRIIFGTYPKYPLTAKSAKEGEVWVEEGV